MATHPYAPREASKWHAGLGSCYHLLMKPNDSHYDPFSMLKNQPADL